MNKKELKIEMLRYGDTGLVLAQALKMAPQTLSNKMNEGNEAEFNQGEIMAIKNRYNLSAERVVEIFFA